MEQYSIRLNLTALVWLSSGLQAICPGIMGQHGVHTNMHARTIYVFTWVIAIFSAALSTKEVQQNHTYILGITR